MKHLLSVGLIVNAVLLSALLLRRDPAVHAAAAGVGTAAGNGDLNGDGAINISDAVYLLSHLFRGGPKPVECPISSTKELPATGQSMCYNTDGDEIACESAICPGQDATYQTGCPVAGRFTDNGDGTVTDTCTGLMWQKETADVNGDGKLSPQSIGGDRLPWCDALDYCKNLDYAGYTDWRLPNVRELESIADYGQFNPAIDSVFVAVSNAYWSSTTRQDYLGYAHLVDFGLGYNGSIFKTAPFYVRAVRSLP